MKTHPIKSQPKTRQRLRSLTLGLTLLGSVGAVQAADQLVNTFDTDVSGIAWTSASYTTRSHIWDGTQDADGNAGSGSMYLTVNWPQYPGWDTGWHDVQTAFSTAPFTIQDYLSVEVSVKIDVTNSSVAVGGNSYGVCQVYLNGGDSGWKQVVNYKVLAVTNGWVRLSGSLAGVTGSNYNQVVIGLISQNSYALTNTVNYWIDNVKLIGPPSVNTNRPAIKIAKAPPAGLTCMATAPGDDWQRQMVRTTNTGYSWHTANAASNTTTYALTVADIPGGANSGFETMMYLIPENGMSNPDGGSVDWDSANVAYFTINANGDGTAKGNFRYKVNSAGAEVFQSWTDLICTNGPLGTWSLTFNDNTNVTITAPNSASTSFTIPDADAANFQGGLIAYFGSRPAGSARIGLSATYSRIKITGAAAAIDDTFTSLDPGTWVKKASSPQGVFITAPDAKYWLTWPQPDNGFTNVFVTGNLTNKAALGQWLSLPASATGWLNVAGASRLAVVNQSALNTAFSYTPSNCFFQLFHP